MKCVTDCHGCSRVEKGLLSLGQLGTLKMELGKNSSLYLFLEKSWAGWLQWHERGRHDRPKENWSVFFFMQVATFWSY